MFLLKRHAFGLIFVVPAKITTHWLKFYHLLVKYLHQILTKKLRGLT
jgi:hypothetical protein